MKLNQRKECFQSAYEELKLVSVFVKDISPVCFQSAYEELKQKVGEPKVTGTPSFQSAYEELKLETYATCCIYMQTVFRVPMRN